MIAWPLSLIREVADRRVVLFVGAGISKAAHAQLPSWSELLIKLSDGLPTKRDKVLLRSLVNKQRMLDAAQIISDGIPKADLNARITEIFRPAPTPHHDIYKDLLEMDAKTIVTTNYDEFIEKNFEHFSGGQITHNVSNLSTNNLINDLRSPMRSIVKIHGCATNPTNIVLDRASYFSARRNNQGLFQTVTALMTVNTVLFVGYSITDPDIQLILENVNLYNPAQHPHYALVEKLEHPAIKKAIAQAYNIECVEYRTGAHQSIIEEIAVLKQSVSNVRSTRGIV